MEKYNSLYNLYFKRLLDLILAIIFIILLLPLFFGISLFIILDSGFPVLYLAKRGGFNEKTFNIFKFRTMIKNADKIGGSTTALNDDRITKVGHFLRKTKLDEIPQLFNILIGEMSFMGPRPELLQYTTQYSYEEKLIFKVRPGITDFSSIEFINLDEIVGKENADEMYEKHVLKKKNQLRIKYAKTVSLKTDLMLFYKTVFMVVKKAVGYKLNN
jgi:lipopolysaccharide/colanic/teichoic acid biosynthesis glycosyltransferase